MFVSSKNPKVAEFEKQCRSRSFTLDGLRAVSINDERFCAWCVKEKLHSKNQKYCSSKCKNSAWAWAYPQSEHGIGMLLHRQDFKCNVCKFDYSIHLDSIAQKEGDRYGTSPSNYRTTFLWHYFSRLKLAVGKLHRPEVDHIVPIYKGGTAIGLDNHQVICNSCHRLKTASDLKNRSQFQTNFAPPKNQGLFDDLAPLSN